jgi:uncharacterized protein
MLIKILKALVLLFCLFITVTFPSFVADSSEKVSRPGEYKGYSEAVYKGMKSKSVYVTMRDGVRLAVDYHLPKGLEKGKKIPAVLVQTRYWRGMVVDINPDPAYKYLTSYGYAVVSVDVRGSGASFGTWPYSLAEDEIKDGTDIVDWIIAQTWSDGQVGSYGTSYTGSTAEFLLTNKHPAVKAIVVRYALFDSYSDIAYPGGIHNDWFLNEWNNANQALDANDTGALLMMMGLTKFKLYGIPGVKPAGPPIKKLIDLKKAVKEHENNGDVYAESKRYQYRDEYSENWGGRIEQISPYYYHDDINDSGAAIYSYSGWFDGGNYTAATTYRYLTLDNCNKLILGPWPHGGDEDVSPWREDVEIEFDHEAELLRFFDYHLKGIDNGIMDEPEVWYFTMGEEKWKSADTWPPKAENTTFYFSDTGELSTIQPEDESFDIYKVDYTTGSGLNSRHNSLVNLKNVPIGYPDRAEQDKKLLIYETQPLDEDLEVSGHPVVNLYVSSDQADSQFFIYLEGVSPGGTVSYITEGVFRGIFRKVSDEEPLYKTAPGVPYHTFNKEDAEPFTPGKVELISFDLMPTSVLFMKGHKIRIAIAGADKDHFALPTIAEPTLKIYRGGKQPSAINLPVVER